MSRQARPHLYLLNTPILTAYGQWQFEGPLVVDEARQLVSDGFTSAIGHDGAAAFLARLLAVEVSVQRITIQMEPGDRALVLRLNARLPEGAVLSEEEMQRFPFELGLLTRIA